MAECQPLVAPSRLLHELGNDEGLEDRAKGTAVARDPLRRYTTQCRKQSGVDERQLGRFDQPLSALLCQGGSVWSRYSCSKTVV